MSGIVEKSAHEIIIEQACELQQLRADHVEMLDKASATVVELREEIERLRAENDELKQTDSYKQFAEIKRLRAALQLVRCAIHRECLELRFKADEVAAIERALEEK